MYIFGISGTVGLDMSQQMKRTIVNGCYDDVEHKIPESCTQLLLVCYSRNSYAFHDNNIPTSMLCQQT